MATTPGSVCGVGSISMMNEAFPEAISFISQITSLIDIHDAEQSLLETLITRDEEYDGDDGDYGDEDDMSWKVMLNAANTKNDAVACNLTKHLRDLVTTMPNPTVKEYYSVLMDLVDKTMSKSHDELNYARQFVGFTSDIAKYNTDFKFDNQAQYADNCIDVADNLVNLSIGDNSMDGIIIFVRMLSGKLLVVNVSEFETVSFVKIVIQSHTDIPVVQQQLIYAGKHLHDSVTLFDYGVKSQTSVELKIRLRGGSDESEDETGELDNSRLSQSKIYSRSSVAAIRHGDIPFNRLFPQSWFRQVECYLNEAKIRSDVSRFNATFPLLPPDLVVDIPTDIVTYSALKTHLLKLTSKSSQQNN